MSETCWAHKKWNKIASDIKLVFHSSIIAIMHGPINIRLYEISSVIYRKKVQCTLFIQLRRNSVTSDWVGFIAFILVFSPPSINLPKLPCRIKPNFFAAESVTCFWSVHFVEPLPQNRYKCHSPASSLYPFYQPV